MADRFPAIEDIDSSHEDNSNNNSNNNNNSSGADLDFLSRERELLGDNAAEFATSSDNMASATVDDGIDDFFIGGGNQHSSSGKEFSAFESSFPNIEAGSTPGNNITNLPTTTSTSQPAPSPSYHGKPEEEETEPIKQWRTRRDQEIEQRAKVSASKKEKTTASAKKWTDDFYEGYNRKKDQSIARARKEAEAYLANREDTTAGGTSWERVAKLVDLSGKGTKGGAAGTGKEKFRELLLGLKADKQAPGAGGYSSGLVD